MCNICEGKRDLYLVAQAFQLLNLVNYDRARYVLAVTSGKFGDLKEMLEESQDGTVNVDLEDFLSDEDLVDEAVMNAMVLVNMSEHFVDEAIVNLTEHGFVIPDATNPKASAFEDYVSNLDLRHDDGED
jgi:hypothetical protein